MDPQVKSFLIHVLSSGLLFTLIFYAFDASEGKGFDLLKFLFRLIVFGLGMALINTFVKRKTRKEEVA